MGHSGAPDVPGGAEGRDMGGHEGGKVQQDALLFDPIVFRTLSKPY